MSLSRETKTLVAKYASDIVLSFDAVRLSSPMEKRDLIAGIATAMVAEALALEEDTSIPSRRSAQEQQSRESADMAAELASYKTAIDLLVAHLGSLVQDLGSLDYCGKGFFSNECCRDKVSDALEANIGALDDSLESAGLDVDELELKLRRTYR